MVNHRLCTFKYHFHMKIMLQTSQVSPYLFVSPHPSFFSSLLNLAHHFSFWNRNKIILSPIWNKNNLFTFCTIWKIQSEKIHLNSFLLWLLLIWSLCPPNANWPLCEQHRAATDRTTTSSRVRFARIFFTLNFLVNQSNRRLYCCLSHSSWPQIYIQSSDWFD